MAASLDTAAGQGRLYINGSLDVTVPTSVVANFDTTMPLRIGMTYHDSAGMLIFDGMIDEVGVWDRVLTESEIQELANVPEPPTLSLTAVALLLAIAAGRASAKAR